jgi:hypothetical protein
MAITEGQIPTALGKTEELLSELGNLRMLLSQAKELSDKGWQIDIGSRIPLIVTISAQQKIDMIAQYDTIKAKLASIYQQLP